MSSSRPDRLRLLAAAIVDNADVRAKDRQFMSKQFAMANKAGTRETFTS